MCVGASRKMIMDKGSIRPLKKIINMKQTVLLFIILILTVLETASSQAQKTERLLVGGCAWDKVAVINKTTGLIVWSHTINPGEDCNDVHMTRKGHVLYAYTSGARLIAFNTQELIWDYKAPAGCELFTATELKNGHFMLAMCGHPARIVELDKRGKQIGEIVFETGIDNVHDQFRQIARAHNGNYVIPFMGTGEIIEMTPLGQVVRRVKTRGNHFAVSLLRNGNWLVACGDAHRIAEIDPETGVEVRVFETRDIQGVDLLFVAEVLPEANGNLLIANWPGHSRDKSQSRLLEIDSTGRVVWQLKNTPEIGNISAMHKLK